MAFPKLKVYVVLGCRVSFIFTFIDLAVCVMTGLFFNTGETNKFLLILLSLMFSLKNNSNSLGVMLKLSFSGIACNKTGGVSSFSPPTNCPLFAHAEINAKQAILISKSQFLILIQLNH